MLTTTDRLKLRLKDVEFTLPQLIIRAAIGLNISSDPYLERDHQLRCIFIHIPKAAGTSLRKSVYGLESFHIPAVRYRAADPKAFASYLKFCFVRNQWDRAFSAYEYLKRVCHANMSYPDHRWAASYLIEYDSFAEFVLSLEDPEIQRRIKRYIHFRDQLSWISDNGKSKRLLVDFVGRYETLIHDYRKLGKMLPIGQSLTSERVNWLKKDYRSVYTSKMTDIIQAVYANDIKEFEYSFE